MKSEKPKKSGKSAAKPEPGNPVLAAEHSQTPARGAWIKTRQPDPRWREAPSSWIGSGVANSVGGDSVAPSR